MTSSSRRAPMLAAFVSRIVELNARTIRMTIRSDQFEGFATDRPGQWVKLFFEENGAGRAFTIRKWRPMLCEMDIDFVRHDIGVAAKWVATASVGSPLWLAGPRSDFIAPGGKTLLLFGDETALPAIAAIVENLPADTTARVFVEVADPCAIQTLESVADVSCTWIAPGSIDGTGEPMTLISCAERACLNPDETCVWVGCESATARCIRERCVSSGFDRTSLHASGYWKRGASEFVDAASDY